MSETPTPSARCKRCREKRQNTVVEGWSEPLHSGWVGRFSLEWKIHPFVPEPE